jgi:predicted acylesterase/phospholipase RssA
VFQKLSRAESDTGWNVAGRVLGILSRYRGQTTEYRRFFGDEMADRAGRLDQLLREEPAVMQGRDALAARLKSKKALLNELAAIVQEEVPFPQVLTEELDEIEKSRQARDPTQVSAGDAGTASVAEAPLRRAAEAKLIGLALSGGGIRSATFNLGILQGLAEHKLLGKMDYLSTVSGGGYIGSWLAAWIREKGSVAQVESELAPQGKDTEPRPIGHLRAFSNYLTPRKGLFSADTWTMAVIWLRNTFLNMVILVAALCALLLVPRFIADLLDRAGPWTYHHLFGWQFLDRLNLLTIVLLLVVAVMMGLNLGRFALSDWIRRRLPWFPSRGALGSRWYERQHWVIVLIVCPLLLAGATAGARLWYFVQSQVIRHPDFPWTVALRAIWPAGAIIWALLLTMALAGKFIRGFIAERNQWVMAWLALLIFPALSATVCVGCLLLVSRLFWIWRAAAGVGNWHAAALGAPLVLMSFSVTMAIQIGLMGRNFPDYQREWVGRLAAWMQILSLGCLAWFAVAVDGPWLLAKAVAWGHTWAKTGLTAGWVAGTLGGLLAGRKDSSASKKLGTVRPLLTTLAPSVFITGLLFALAAVLESWFHDASVRYVLYAFLGLLGIAFGLSRTVDVNEFSMHNFYKNRLVRCYLGASRDGRRPNWFTDFDPDDDRILASYLCDGPTSPYAGPYPIINCTINLTGGQRLAWQERKAASFVFTPKYCGFDLGAPAYRPTNTYAYPVYGDTDGGVNVGTAMAISGAAATPNMGYHSSPPFAFLMTLFNVRLGWWMGNTLRDKKWTNAGPRLGLPYLLSELFGLSNEHRDYVYLSDGGHFENLGIYELVRRRCHYIIACDAGQDQKMTFADLADAVRKCRIDFRVEVDVKERTLLPPKDDEWCPRHCVVGEIRYPDGQRGTLIYVKASLTGNEPSDVLEYRKRQPAFPHQSTGDQFFDESQFESYRSLGYHIATTELAALAGAC